VIGRVVPEPKKRLPKKNSPWQDRAVQEFRYAQFCPLARAAEVVGHRWTLLILRELAIGPQRFSDLQRRLAGVSSSVLAARLADLEGHGVVARRELPPPAASQVYELTDHGRALRPVLGALARWGLAWLGAPRPGDHVEPDWLRLAVEAFAAPGPSPARRYELRARAGGREAVIPLAGGRGGTQVPAERGEADARVAGPVPVLLGLLSGRLSPDAAVAAGAEIEGDREALRDLPSLFAFPAPPAPPPTRPPNPWNAG
jgi:DNA-binding HxlR family transcriptional regulator